MADQQPTSGLDGNSVDTSSDVTDYVKYLKLAVAVAIIRSRPGGMTGQQYSQQLCARYQQAQLSWKQEACRLRQQLDVVLQQKSVLDQFDGRPLTPPSSMEAASTATSTSRHGGSALLSRHLAFLAGVLSLDSVAAAGQRSAAASHVVASTVQLVLDAVLRRLERYHDDDDDVMSHSAAVHAVDVVARVCDVTDTAVCDSVQQFARNVVASIMSSQPVNQSDRQQAACDFLLSLSTSKSLQPNVIDVLLDAVADVADRLRRVAAAADDDDDDDGAAGFPAASELENVAYVLDCAERVLAAAGVDGVAVELRRRLSSQLELSLRHVANRFPLFAYRVWQLGGVVDSRQRSSVDETTALDRQTDY